MPILIECDRCGRMIQNTDVDSGFINVTIHDRRDDEHDDLYFCAPCMETFSEWKEDGLRWRYYVEPEQVMAPERESPRETFDRMEEQRDRKRWETERRIKRERGISDGADRSS